MQENVLYDILERKNGFLGYKNKMFKKSKNWHFSKGVHPWFWSKNGHFSNFFVLGNIGQENILNDILERKNGFLGYKNKMLRKSKKWQFSKGVNPWYGKPNVAIFNSFCFICSFVFCVQLYAFNIQLVFNIQYVIQYSTSHSRFNYSFYIQFLIHPFNYLFNNFNHLFNIQL